MRIISGKYRGKKLVAAEGEVFRPTLDRVKETLFNILQSRIYDSTVLDMFAGSGALGIECISRGCKNAVFIENSAQSLNPLKKNLLSLSSGNYSVYESDYELALRKLTGKRFDIIFVDPPYDSDYYYKSLKAIDEYELLAEGGVVVCEHRRQYILPDCVGCLIKTREKCIGTVALSFYGAKL